MSFEIKVYVDERFGIDKVIKRFKRICDAYGVVKEFKRKVEYKKPSVLLKEKLESAKKRRLKNESRLRRIQFNKTIS
jgi:small subunit ribosomal protein S21